MSKIESTPSKQVSAPTPQISTKIGSPLKITMKIGNLIALVAFIIFFVPYPGAQMTTYSLLILSALISSFIIERSVSLRNRGKHKSFLKLLILVSQNLIPPLFVIFQMVLLYLLFRSHSDVMSAKDASGNLPPMLVRYNGAAFGFVITQIVLLYFYTTKMVRGGAHPNPVMTYVELAAVPGFVCLGALTLLYTALLYVTIVRYITDG